MVSMVEMDSLIRYTKDFLIDNNLDYIDDIIDKDNNNIFKLDYKELQDSNTIFKEAKLGTQELDSLIKSSFISILEDRSELDKERMELIDDIRVATSNHLHPLKVYLGSVTTKHIDKLIQARGMVIQHTFPKPTLKKAAYECGKCKTTFMIDIDGLNIEKPYECPEAECNNTKYFKLKKEHCDTQITQRLLIQEPYEDSEMASKPIQLECFIPENLVNRFEEGLSNIFIGYLRLKDHENKSTTMDWYLEVVDIQPDKDSLENTTIEPNDIDKLKSLALSNNHVNELIKYIVPKVKGMDNIKKAILLQLVGGVTRETHINNRKRGEIHLMMVGNPGTAKSELMNSVRNIVPRVQTANGGDTTRVGLTASVQQMEFMGSKEVVLTPGALVLGNKGIVLIDEFDKMRDDDKASLHTAMEDGKINIHKFNQHQVLKTETSIMASANPRNNVFNHKGIQELPFSPSLLSRFDLVFLIDNTVINDNMEDIYDSIFSYNNNIDDSVDLDVDFIRKYISHAKKFNPVVPKELVNDYKREAFNLFKNIKEGSESLKGFNLRVANTIQRLSEASAKLRFSNEINIEDLLFAKELIIDSYESAGIKIRNTKTDLSLLQSGMNTEAKTTLDLVSKAFDDYSDLEYDRIKEMFGEDIDFFLNKLIVSGNIYEYKPRCYRKM